MALVPVAQLDALGWFLTGSKFANSGIRRSYLGLKSPEG